MTEKQKAKVLLTRPRFTDDHEQPGDVKSKTVEHIRPSERLKTGGHTIAQHQADIDWFGATQWHARQSMYWEDF